MIEPDMMCPVFFYAQKQLKNKPLKCDITHVNQYLDRLHHQQNVTFVTKRKINKNSLK